MPTNSTSAPLPDYIEKTILEIQSRIADHERDILKCKEMVNGLLLMNGRPLLYTDLTINEAVSLSPIRRDQFFGRPLSTVVKEILTRRRAAGEGSASVGEIYKTMVEGGYQFEAKDDENAKRGLRISLAKNSATFIKLPHGDYGLKEWYPTAKEPKQQPQPTLVKPPSDRPSATPDEEESKPKKSAFVVTTSGEDDDEVPDEDQEDGEPHLSNGRRDDQPEVESGDVDDFGSRERDEEVPDFMRRGGQEEDIPF